MHHDPNGVQGVIFDLSGTVLDYGSRGPVAAFVELFARHSVAVTDAEARRPMGTHKRDHIAAMLSDSAISGRWVTAHGAMPDAPVLDALYAEFTPLQVEQLESHCELIPGVLELVAELDRRGIPFASTTGFDSRMMAGLIQSATSAGFRPKVFLTPDLAGGGRPAPWMAFLAAREMDVYPMSSIVKVGDTPVDIAEAQNAGMWAVAVVASGNEIGLSQAELDALAPDIREELLTAAREKFTSLGAHYVIDTVAAMLPVLDDISSRIRRGERP